MWTACHGLTQHSFSHGRTKGRDWTQTAALHSPQTWQEQSSIPPAARIRDTAKGVFGQTHPWHQLPLGGRSADSQPLPPSSLRWKQGYLQGHDGSASIRAWHMPGVLIHGKRKGESVVWVWRQSGLEQLLRAKILVCNGFIYCSNSDLQSSYTTGGRDTLGKRFTFPSNFARNLSYNLDEATKYVTGFNITYCSNLH